MQLNSTTGSEARRIAHVVLHELPVAEQVRALVVAIIARNEPDPLRALVSMSATMTAMASFLNERDRFVLVRSCATVPM